MKIKIKQKKLIWLCAVAITVLAVLILILCIAGADDAPDDNQISFRNESHKIQPVSLGSGISIDAVGDYAGVYMEDGTDEFVESVMMIRVTNSGSADLQLMNISVVCDSKEEYVFQVTDLSAGSSAVLLEKNRKPYSDCEITSAIAENVVLHETSMNIHSDKLEVSGSDGIISVSNISQKDIESDIYIYYKYAADDMFYGGITYRAVVTGGISSGEAKNILTSHYKPDKCELVNIAYGQN